MNNIVLCGFMGCGKSTVGKNIARLIVGRIIAVPGKAVKFPDQHNVKQPLLAVLDHLLEIRAVVGFCGKGAVNVVLDHGDAVLFGISRTFTNLAFDDSSR